MTIVVCIVVRLVMVSEFVLMLCILVLLECGLFLETVCEFVYC